MTYRELYVKAKRALAAAEIDCLGNDAAVLMSHFFGVDRPGLAVHGGENPAQEREQSFLRALEERAHRRPLQYILGSWEFLGLSLKVGEGVLIPREDTAVLVKALAQKLSGVPTPAGVDLCAGSGAVGLGLCSLIPQAETVCVEVSPQAFPYLEENLAAYPQYRTRALQADILLPETAGLFSPASLDFIASNPPYIPSGQLSSLQAEVRREPLLALDGGMDGLIFYRAILKLWLPLLKPGGILAVETDDQQAREVLRLFQNHGLYGLEIFQDLGGLDRCVVGFLAPARL